MFCSLFPGLAPYTPDVFAKTSFSKHLTDIAGASKYTVGKSLKGDIYFGCLNKLIIRNKKLIDS